MAILEGFYQRTCLASFVCCMLGVLALVSPSWTEGKFGNFEFVRTGLLLFCHRYHYSVSNISVDTQCAPFIFGQNTAWFEAVQLLSLLSWVLIFTVFVQSILLYYHDLQHAFSLLLVIKGLLAGALGIAGAFVFAIAWTVTPLVAYYDVTLSWGFAVYVIWHIVTLGSFILITILGRDIWRAKVLLSQRRK